MRYDAILIDQANLSHRTFHTAQQLTTTIDGETRPIGMVYGFIRSVMKLYEELAETKGAIFVLCDEDDSTARKDMWPGYKRSRKTHHVDYDTQRAIIRRMSMELGWCRAWCPSWEADDVVATLAKSMEEAGRKVAIVTGDHDSHQCVTEQVHVVDPNSKKHSLQDGRAWRRRDVEKKWGVPSALIRDVKAISGDTSDEYPGMSGYGDKWAQALVAKYGDIDQILDHARANSQFEVSLSTKNGEATRTKNTVPFIENEAELRTFRDLATLRRDLDLTFGVRYPDPDPQAVFRSLRFASLAAPSQIAVARSMAGKR